MFSFLKDWFNKVKETYAVVYCEAEFNVAKLMFTPEVDTAIISPVGKEV